MSLFREIFGSIFGRNDKRQNDRDRGTSQNNTSVESAYSNTSVGGNSSPTVNDQSDKTIYYYEYYPNLSIGKSIIKEPNAASLQSKHEVSRSSSTSSELPQSSTKQTPPSPAPKAPTCFAESSSFPKPQSSSVKPPLFSTGAPPSSSTSSSSFTKPARPPSSPAPKAPTSFAESSSFPKPQSSSFKRPLFSTGAPPSSSTSSSSFTKPARPPSSSDQPQSFSKGTSSSYDLSQSSSARSSTSSLNAPPPSKVTLSALPTDSRDQRTKANYTYVQKTSSPIYMIPKDIEDLIKKDIVPDVLNKPLSPSTYKDYFAALLYAEDFYIEKWSGFQLFNVALKLHEAAIYNKSSKKKELKESDEKHDKIFVAFEIDSVPERRPFLLSRDFVYARPIGKEANQFQGFIYRVVKSNIVLVEFEEDFYSQHHPNRKYDISFSFNRVCLKRAHQAIAAASGPSFQDYLFPDYASRKNILTSAPVLYSSYNHGSDKNSAVHQILNFRGSPPYLLEGPPSVVDRQLSKTGIVVEEAVLQIYRSSRKNRILICAPINRTCDVLMRSLKKEIPESDMFRANAAFREVDGVPVDILPLCLFEGECFSCPSLEELRQFRVIFSTFVSSFRLNNEGLTAGHFSHVFLVDASSATEPETMIALTNLANENTSVIVTGAPNNHSSWIRSDIARKKGLRMSYFERLRENKTYKSLQPMFITRL